MTASIIAFNGEARHIDFHKLIGKQVYIYDQKEVVTDLIARRLADGGQILFEVEDTSVHDFSGEPAEDPLPPRRQGAGDRMRLHRRLRRLPRHLPAEHSRPRAARLRPGLSVRLARHPLRNRRRRRTS